VFGRCHEPCARIVGYAGVRPFLEGNYQRIHREIFRKSNIVNNAGKPRYELWRLNPPNCFYCPVGV
jgi:hypothetical protein